MFLHKVFFKVVISFFLIFSFSARASETLSIVTTTGMIADSVKRIGGEHVAVKNIMGAGVDPHSYRQTRSDVIALSKADLILWHGLFLEAQLQPLMKKLSKSENVYAVAESLPKDILLSHDEYKNKYDPHIWMDPDLWIYVVEHIKQILIEYQPENEAIFIENAQAFNAELKQLKQYANTQLDQISDDQRILITAHDAFNYFGDAFKFEVLGIQGLSTESEAGINRISELVDFIVVRKIKAVFVETSVSDRNIRALIEGAAAQGHKLNVGGSLFSDAMGRPGSYEGSYIGMIDHNVTTISSALGAQTPEKGMQGKLNLEQRS